MAKAKTAIPARRKIFVEAYPSMSVQNDPLVVIKLADFDTCELNQPVSLKHKNAGDLVVALLEVMAFHGDKAAQLILDEHFRDDDNLEDYAKIS